MFTLAPSSLRVADVARVALPVHPGDWCGTRPPGDHFTPEGPHTAPGSLEARATLQVGMRELAAAASKLDPVMPLHAVGDDSRYVDYEGAIRHAANGLAAIDATRGADLPASVSAALEAAGADARVGYQQLTAETRGPGFDRIATSHRFNAASNWLSVASNLLELELGALPR